MMNTRKKRNRIDSDDNIQSLQTNKRNRSGSNENLKPSDDSLIPDEKETFIGMKRRRVHVLSSSDVEDHNENNLVNTQDTIIMNESELNDIDCDDNSDQSQKTNNKNKTSKSFTKTDLKNDLELIVDLRHKLDELKVKIPNVNEFDLYINLKEEAFSLENVLVNFGVLDKVTEVPEEERVPSEIYESAYFPKQQNSNLGSIKLMTAARNAIKKRPYKKFIKEDSPEIHPSMSAMVKNAVKKNAKIRMKEDDNDGRESDGDDAEYQKNDSDDSEEETIISKASMPAVLKFFNEATNDEFVNMPGCSQKKASLIIKSRPFSDFKDLESKLSKRPLNVSLIHNCKELFRTRNSIVKLMQECEKISEVMENVVGVVTGTKKGGQREKDMINKMPKDLNPNMHLAPYQMAGLNWLVLMYANSYNGILADEMGLGKTIQTIAFLAYLRESDVKKPHAIVVPSSTIDNWLRELKTWAPAIKVLLYYGSMEDRKQIRNDIYKGLNDPFDVILTTYNMVTGNSDDRFLFKMVELEYVIYDEGHMLKNMKSQRFTNLMKVKCTRRLLLTGTPLQNNLIELMSLLCFIMPKMFYNQTEEIKSSFSTFTGNSKDKCKSAYEEERIEQAKKIIKPFILRRLKADVLQQLPAKKAEIVKVDMVSDQAKLYDDLVKKFQLTVDERKAAIKRGEEVSSLVGSMLMDLRKAANHPLLLRNHYTNDKLRQMSIAGAKEKKDRDADYLFEDMEVMNDFELMKLCKSGDFKSFKKFAIPDSLIYESGKFHYLKTLLSELKEQGNRVLLFSQFKIVLDIVEPFLKHCNYKYIRLDGSTMVTERQDMIDNYNDDPSIFIFILTTRAGGLGINLTSANTVIIHDIDFNPYCDKQAEDRCHRVGQEQEVTVYRLLSKNTIEEGMYKKAEMKLKLERDITGKGDEENDSIDLASILKDALSS